MNRSETEAYLENTLYKEAAPFGKGLALLDQGKQWLGKVLSDPEKETKVPITGTSIPSGSDIASFDANYNMYLRQQNKNKAPVISREDYKTKYIDPLKPYIATKPGQKVDIQKILDFRYKDPKRFAEMRKHVPQLDLEFKKALRHRGITEAQLDQAVALYKQRQAAAGPEAKKESFEQYSKKYLTPAQQWQAMKPEQQLNWYMANPQKAQEILKNVPSAKAAFDKALADNNVTPEQLQQAQKAYQWNAANQKAMATAAGAATQVPGMPPGASAAGQVAAQSFKPQPFSEYRKEILDPAQEWQSKSGLGKFWWYLTNREKAEDIFRKYPGAREEFTKAKAKIMPWIIGGGLGIMGIVALLLLTRGGGGQPTQQPVRTDYMRPEWQR